MAVLCSGAGEGGRKSIATTGISFSISSPFGAWSGIADFRFEISNLDPLLSFLREYLHEVKERLGGLLQPSPGVELQLAVEVVAACEEFRRGQPPECHVRPAGAP